MVRAALGRILTVAATAVCVAAASCGTPAAEEPDYVRVVVDIDPKLVVPDDLDGFVIEVVRGSTKIDTKSYDAAVMGKLPDSLIIYNPHPNNDSPEKQLTSVPMLKVRLTGYKGAEAVLYNAFELRFNAGKLQVGLPMCRDCYGHAACGEGETCRRNACVDAGEVKTAKDEAGVIDALTDCGP